MDKFELNILGCGSALPTSRFNPTSQVVNFREKLFLIDCGEGSQLQMRLNKLKMNRLGHIFLSHLHGDHCFGLMGFISTLGLLDRTADLVIHAHPDAERIFRPQLDYFCADLPFKVIFDNISPQKHALIYEERSLKVYSIPLKHRVPTCGYLFEEEAKERHINKEMAIFYKVPLRYFIALKEGLDFTTEDGEVIPNSRLTREPEPARKYAFCSDTAPSNSIIPIIEGVDLLYHEATFAETEVNRAKTTMHSTASQAAEIALKAQVKKLLIGHYSARYRDLSVLLNEAKAIFPNTYLSDETSTIEI
ncbi:MAG: ribonuclease Z [Bacteroidales bacterium]|nr:ribonuclease Z [Bacteroidales bacterium]